MWKVGTRRHEGSHWSLLYLFAAAVGAAVLSLSPQGLCFVLPEVLSWDGRMWT